MNKQKGLAPILIVLIIAVALIAGYSLYQKQTPLSKSPSYQAQQTTRPSPSSVEETVSWKTYTDDYWQISFNYPQTWEVKIYGYDQKASMSIELTNKSMPIISFHLVANPKNLSLQELDQENARKDKERNTGVDTPRLSVNNYSLVIIGNGISAYYEKEYFCEPSICKRYVLTPKNKVVEIILFPREDYQQSVNQILSTFKFQ